MNDIAIKVENLSKRYRIGLKEEVHDTLAGAMGDWIKRPIHNLRRLRQLTRFSENGHDPDDIIWALKDVSFEVKQGEVVGVIGRNGAGKSTLLKILSRITHPTSGRVMLNGRVSSLLEVGTGFHPELTGRENIYLNGTILGMRKAEIDHKFDEIVDFSGVEKFIDTPVKRYSSGMRVRLAFSVAAHLEPEILLVDEVLAVGDIEFQKKSLGKMEYVGKEGKTVLFVSHNMQMILRLCNRAILFSEGDILRDSTTSNVISYYVGGGKGLFSQRVWKHDNVSSNDVAQLLAMCVFDQNGSSTGEVDIESPVDVKVEYELLQDLKGISILLGFYNMDGTCLFISQDINNTAWRNRVRKKGVMHSTLHIPGHFFAEGQISVNLMLITIEPTFVHIHERDVVSFVVVDHTDGIGVRGEYAKEWPGVLRPMLNWTIGESV